MNADQCVNEEITEEEVKGAIRTIHILRTAMGDEQGNLQNLARVLEVMYGVTYEVDDEDIIELERVLNGMDTSAATRLDPTHIREMQDMAGLLLNQFDQYIEYDLFDEVPEISIECTDNR